LRSWEYERRKGNNKKINENGKRERERHTHTQTPLMKAVMNRITYLLKKVIIYLYFHTFIN
jgi:hypothetical protein